MRNMRRAGCIDARPTLIFVRPRPTVAVPSFYVVLQRFHERTQRRRVALSGASSAHRPAADSPPSSST
jgi:hypothetical protein